MTGYSERACLIRVQQNQPMFCGKLTDGHQSLSWEHTDVGEVRWRPKRLMMTVGVSGLEGKSGREEKVKL